MALTVTLEQRTKKFVLLGGPLAHLLSVKEIEISDHTMANSNNDQRCRFECCEHVEYDEQI